MMAGGSKDQELNRLMTSMSSYWNERAQGPTVLPACYRGYSNLL